VYADGGVYTIDVTVSDDDSGVASAAVRAVVSGVGLHEINGENVLQIIGTSADDHLTLNQTGNGTLKVHADFVDTRDFNLADVDQIFAFMCAGDDHVNVSSKITLETLIHGGSGNDHLNGGGGSNILLGGSGNDHLNGGSARDILIGGDGEDRIVGNRGEDMLVGGRLADDVHFLALLDLLDRWNEDVPFADRVADLQDEIDAIFADDGDLDTLTGASGEDWFILGAGDTATDSSSGNGGGGGGGSKGRKK
jgi:Ca2+-binding RTX toxin-like protein